MSQPRFATISARRSSTRSFREACVCLKHRASAFRSRCTATIHGVLQPIIVTETLDGYQLVAGERRFRASKQAGLERIPAVIRQLADRDQLELALVENLQRADLGPLEEAHAYQALSAEFSMTHD